MRIGSLFSGYGGLDMAVQSVLGGTVAWYSEIEPAACRVLEAHLPGVPNLGDVTKVDWSAVEPVDVLTGGYPCQPFSHAGKRKGTNDERHLWPYVRDALAALRPMVAVFENVDGHRSLGLADVLGDLADLGLSARWGVVRAAYAGAPHGRKRVFIVAYPEGWGRGTRTGPAAASRGHITEGTSDRCGESVADPDIAGSQGADAGLDVAAGWGDAGGHAAAAPATDADGDGHGSQLHARGVGSLEAGAEGQPCERERPRPEPVPGSGISPADAESAGRVRASEPQDDDSDTGRGRRHDAPDLGEGDRPVAWGKYEPAIRRWERVIDRPAPAPTVLGSSGRPRLSPAFVEWMMGLPEGHVTGHGLSNAQALKMLGNGVVPQQAALALHLLGVAA